jgi:hypothetical protein
LALGYFVGSVRAAAVPAFVAYSLLPVFFSGLVVGVLCFFF